MSAGAGLNCRVCGRSLAGTANTVWCAYCIVLYPAGWAAYQGQPEPQNGNTPEEQARSAAATDRVLQDAFWPERGGTI